MARGEAIPKGWNWKSAGHAMVSKQWLDILRMDCHIRRHLHSHSTNAVRIQAKRTNWNGLEIHLLDWIVPRLVKALTTNEKRPYNVWSNCHVRYVFYTLIDRRKSLSYFAHLNIVTHQFYFKNRFHSFCIPTIGILAWRHIMTKDQDTAW